MAEIIVEIGNSHEGSLGIACSMVDMAKLAGATTVKFQFHWPEFESTANEPFRVKFSMQDETRIDYWNRVNFSFEDWDKLITYVHEQGLEFLCTPFSVEAAKWLFSKKAIKRWKVGSGDASNFPLIDYLVSTELPLIISTGLISSNELRLLVKRLEVAKALDRTTLLHCISKYPVPLEEVSLHLMTELGKYTNRVGYSDHSGKLSPSMVALAMGAEIVEVHMTPHPNFFGPDTKASLTPEQIASLISLSKELVLMNSKSLTKDEVFESVKDSARIFRKGVYWNIDLPAGTVINMTHLAFKKPVISLEAIDVDLILGKVVSVDVLASQPVNLNQILE